MTKVKTIVTGHGKFATGMKTAVTLLAGEQKALTFIDFEESMTSDDLGAKLQVAYMGEPTLFFTDLVGGTPYKEAAKIAFSNSDVAVVAGCNLASLLEAIFDDYQSTDDYANALVESTQKSAQVLNLQDDDESAEDDEFEDGI